MNATHLLQLETDTEGPMAIKDPTLGVYPLLEVGDFPIKSYLYVGYPSGALTAASEMH